MKPVKLISRCFFSSSAILLSISQVILPSKVRAEIAVCPSDWSTYADVQAYADDPTYNGNCRGTPDEYGVTVYKMGFCETELAAGGAGTTPDYDSCVITYENESGEYSSFESGSSNNLDEDYATFPSEGSYNYAFILLGNEIKIKSKFGPFGDGNTYYTNGDSPDSSGLVGNMSTDSDDYSINTSELNSFDGVGGTCKSVWSELDDNPSATDPLKAYLISSTAGSIIPDTGASGDCSGHNKILGVMSASITITEDTTSLTSNFSVTDNGTTFWVAEDGTPTGDSGPFNVTFTIEE